MKRKKDQMALHLMMLPGMILLAIFSFTPMFGIIMAFQNYMPARGIANPWGRPWDNFIFMFQMPGQQADFHQYHHDCGGKDHPEHLRDDCFRAAAE